MCSWQVRVYTCIPTPNAYVFLYIQLRRYMSIQKLYQNLHCINKNLSVPPKNQAEIEIKQLNKKECLFILFLLIHCSTTFSSFFHKQKSYKSPPLFKWQSELLCNHLTLGSVALQERRKYKKNHKQMLTGGKPGRAHKHKSTQENQQNVWQYEGEDVLGVTEQRTHSHQNKTCRYCLSIAEPHSLTTETCTVLSQTA